MVVSDCGQKRHRLLHFNDQARNNRDQRQLATSCELTSRIPSRTVVGDSRSHSDRRLVGLLDGHEPAGVVVGRPDLA
jgi:hypothetical protein